MWVLKTLNAKETRHAVSVYRTLSYETANGFRHSVEIEGSRRSTLNQGVIEEWHVRYFQEKEGLPTVNEVFRDNIGIIGYLNDSDRRPSLPAEYADVINEDMRPDLEMRSLTLSQPSPEEIKEWNFRDHLGQI